MKIAAVEKEVLELPQNRARSSREKSSRARRALDKHFTASRVNQLIQEAMDSGPETPLTKEDFDDVFKRVLKKAAK
jgi:hypothetical protein